jgi:serine/threonine-protein kinase
LEKDSSLRYQHADGVVSDLKRLEKLSAERPAIKTKRDDKRKMMVVLPFENLGPLDEEYFADGMTEEIISRLATIHELGVISRTSAMTYKQTTKSIREIGSELGVDYVLEGSVRWNRKVKDIDRVRITPQLISVSDDTQLWSDRYDRTLDDIFEVQTQIAEHVVEQLNIKLLGSERRVLQVKPTDNLEAYQFYLRGLEYAGRPDYALQDYRLAQQMFERAVDLDPTFALAYADLSRTYSLLYFHGYDRSPECVSGAKIAVDRAHSLDPDMAEVHLAFGYFYYYCTQNYDLAFEELDRVKKHLPSDSRVLSLTAAIVKRQGRIAESVEYYKRAFETSPRDASLPHEIGCAYMTIREYSEAHHYYNLSISLSANQVSVFVCKAWNYWLWQGDVFKGRDAAALIPDGREREPFELCRAHLFARNYDTVLELLAAAPETYEVGQWCLVPKASFRAFAYQLMGDIEQARTNYESAREFLEVEVDKSPNDDRVRASLGIAYAGLGHAEDAIREAKLAVTLMPVAENAVVGPFRVEDLAFTYALLGERDAAINQLEYLLSIPSWLSAPLLRIDPRWDLLRDHPRFQALLEKYDNNRSQ